MKKSSIAIIAIIAALAVAVAVLAALHWPSTAARQQLRADEVFLIIAGEKEHRVTVEDIQALGLRAVEANYKKSGKPAETRVFSGLPFAEILEHKGIDAAGLSTAVFAAADGYQVPLAIDRALNDAFIALCDEAGPFRMILPNDQFSQHWCGYLTDVTLK